MFKIKVRAKQVMSCKVRWLNTGKMCELHEMEIQQVVVVGMATKWEAEIISE